MSELEQYVNKQVWLMTGEGRCLTGELRGFDQTINVILESAVERIYSEGAGIEQVPLGLYIVRGDNVAVIGELDEELDSRIDFEKIRAKPLEPIWIPQ